MNKRKIAGRRLGKLLDDEDVENETHVSIQFHKKYNDQFWSNKIISQNTLNVCRGINLRAFSKLVRFKYVLIADLAGKIVKMCFFGKLLNLKQFNC